MKKCGSQEEDEDDEEVPENEKYNLLRTDYNWIATTDKGSPAQVINLKEFGIFNIQPSLLTSALGHPTKI